MDTEKQKLNLLCDAAQLLLENGSETYRVEETAQRMAKGLNIEYVNIAALPTTVFLEADGRAYRGTETHLCAAGIPSAGDCGRGHPCAGG